MNHKYTIEYEGVNGKREFANTDKLIINGIPFEENTDVVNSISNLYLFKSIIFWYNPIVILPNNDDKMLVITETKKGARQINIAYYGGQFWHGMGSMSKVIAWSYMPDVNSCYHGGFTHSVEKKAGVQHD